MAFVARLDGDDAACREIIAVFLQDVPGRIAQVRQAIQDSDATALERHVHTLKGAAANVSAEALRAVALEMETCARAGALDKAAALGPELERRFELLKQTLHDLGYC